MFVFLIPTLMWWVSGMPSMREVPVWKLVLAIALALLGLTLSVWSIVYMRRKGDGNPMDAFGHEVAPRTKHLMTEGPYRLSRNPMLTGSFVYYAGVCIWLWKWPALLACDHHFALAQGIENVLGTVGNLIDPVQAEKTRGALQRMHGAEDLVEQGKIVRCLFQFQKIGFDGFEMLSRFCNKICKKFWIKHVLAHTVLPS